MKYNIEGFNQKNAIEFKDMIDGKEVRLDCIDLVLLRWFVDFYPRANKKIIDDKEYAWISYATILDDLPILNMKKVQLSRRFNKFVHFKILDFKLYKVGGTFTYYTYGINYKSLVETVENSKDSCTLNNNGSTKKYNGINKNVETVYTEKCNPFVQKCLNKDPSTINYSTNNYSTKYPSPCDENLVDVEKLKSQIQYDRLIAEAHSDSKILKIITLIVSLAGGCNNSKHQTVKISNVDYPIDEVRKKINALDYETCNAIIDRILNAGNIKRIQSLTLWCILNLTAFNYDEDTARKRIKTVTEKQSDDGYSMLLNIKGGVSE